MKNLFYFLSFFLLLSVSLFPQSKYLPYHHPLSGALCISAEGGFTVAKTDFRNSNFGYMAKGSFEYFFPSNSIGAFGLKFTGGLGTIAGDNGGVYLRPRIESFRTNVYMFGGGVQYILNFGIVNPYAFAGAYYISFKPKDYLGNTLERAEAGEYSLTEPNYSGEIGIKFLLSDELSLNASAATYISPNDNLDDFPNQVSGGVANDLYYSFTAGLTYYFQPTRDSDNDGIEDENDACPDTPEGVQVDVIGCPIDSDGDAVPDYLDKCPRTPSGIKVDTEGCPLDKDMDGVPDYMDICPGTSLLIKVDDKGCPLDTDLDGVPDSKDKCPDTPAGMDVDTNGCEIVSLPPVKESKKIILNGKTNFAQNSSQLTPNAEEILFGLIDVMKDNPDSRWLIEGYTDNVGNYEYNVKLSLERAKTVMNYFIDFGISRNRFEVYGRGPENPIGDNKLEIGRSLNRRVEIQSISPVEVKVSGQNESGRSSITYDYSNDRIVDGTIFTDGNLFTIQASSWETKTKAESEVNKLEARGHIADVFETVVDNKKRYRVRIGYFNSLENARDYIDEYFAPGK